MKKLLQRLAGNAKILAALFLIPSIAYPVPVTFEFEGIIGLSCHICVDSSDNFGTGVAPGTPFFGRYTFDSNVAATPTNSPNRVNYFGLSIEISIGTEFVNDNDPSTSRVTIANGPPEGDSYSLYSSAFSSGSIAGVYIDTFSWVVSADSSLFADLDLPTSPEFFGPRVGSRICIGDCFNGEILEGEITTLRAVTNETYGGVEFPAGAISFADYAHTYRTRYSGGPEPDVTQQEFRQILGVPEVGEMSLGQGGRITVSFWDNRLTGSDDSTPDLYIFEVGAPETVFVEVRNQYGRWVDVGTATGFAAGIDIDQYGFNSSSEIRVVRLTDDGDSLGDDALTAGADIVAVGARSTIPLLDSWGKYGPGYSLYVQAHVGGRSELIIQGSKLQWHHLQGTAPGLERQFWSPGRDANSPTIIESLLGPVISWVPTGWPVNLGNGTHPESYSSVFTGLTPVLPPTDRCFRVEKQWGDGDVYIVQQPDQSNDYTLVVRFDDLRKSKAQNPEGYSGVLRMEHGSGFYAIKLKRKEGYRHCW